METTSQKTTRRNYRAQFKESFATVVLLMKEEWAALEDDALAELDGDLEQAVALLATHLESTKAAARRHIVELVDLAVSQEAHRERSNGAAPPTEGEAPRSKLPPLDDVFAALHRLETFAVEEAKRVSEIIPEAKAHAQKSMWRTILMALGIGLLLGMWLNRGRKK